MRTKLLTTFATLAMLMCNLSVSAEAITSTSQLSNDVLYHVSTPRGSWAVSEYGTTLKSNSELSITVNSSDTRQQFAFISLDGAVRYLYHPARGMFVNKDGSLSTNANDPIYFRAGAYANTFVAYFDEQHYINIGGYKELALNTWNTADDGNSCTILPVGEFDFDELISKQVIDGIVYAKTAEDELEVMSGELASGELEIPSTVTIVGKTYRVTSIGERAFSGCSNLTSVTIPESVTTIGYYAFSGCSSLTSVNIPESVTEIGYEAFSGCSSLTSITIPEGVTSIGDGVFYGCSNLERVVINCANVGNWFGGNDAIKEVVLGENVTSIWYAFRDCSNLTSVTIPEGVTTIGYYAFSGCSSLASVTIPKSVTSIGSSAFEYCSSLTSIAIPEGVTSIGEQAFRYCSSLTSITIPESVTTIGESAFYGCSFAHSNFKNNSACTDSYNWGATIIDAEEYDGLFISDNVVVGCRPNVTSVTIPEGVTSIGRSAFYYCRSLASINIPESVTEIGDYAFYDCRSLTSVNIPESVTSIGESAFYECSNLKLVINYSDLTLQKGSWDNGYVAYYADIAVNVDEFIGDYAFKTKDGVHYLTGYIGDDTELTLPNDYQGENYQIGVYAFYNCNSLTSITIPECVTSIGDEAFSGCTGELTINCNIPSGEYNNYPFRGSEFAKVTIGDKVTSIGDYAFYGCSSLTDIILPESITSIGNRAFYGTAWYNNQPDGVIYINNILCGYKGEMPENTSIEVREGTISINPYVFSGCSNLTSIAIPEGVTSIGSYAFYGCNNLTAITIPESVTNIGENAFRECSNLERVTINCANVGRWFSYNNTIKEVILGESVTSIGDYAFQGFSSLTSLTIPESVTSIGNAAFYGCSSLTSLTIPESVTSIGYYAFYGCSSLTAITIPEGVTSIGIYAFGYCSSLTDITIPKSVTEIGKMAFYNCSSFEDFTIPEGVTEIGEQAFRSCSNLTSITIPEGVTEIGNYAFSDCSSLTAIIVEEGNEVYDSRNGCNAIIETNSNTLIQSCSTTIIPESVTKIGYGAFYDCSNFTTIAIPESVTSIGMGAFYGCTNLTSITIPESVTSIGDYAFAGCTNLTSINIPENVASIGEGVFEECTSLTSINIPESVTSIGNYAFYGCSSLTAITIPESVTSIGYDAFSGCTNLTSITIPEGVTEIGEEAFDGTAWYDNQPDGVTYINNILYKYKGDMPENTTIEVREGTISIGEKAFRFCRGLTNIIMPESVTAIGDWAFSDCESLATINIPEGVTSIGRHAFDGCDNLATINIPNSVTRIRYDAFYGTAWYYNQPDGAVYAGRVLYKYKGDMPENTTIEVREGTVSIGEEAFYYCSNLTDINIPESVTLIGEDAFRECSSLTDINIPESVTEIGGHAFYGTAWYNNQPDGLIYINNVLYEYKGEMPENTSIDVREGTVSISSYAFDGYRNLTDITIPESVTLIGECTFRNCSKLTAITIKAITPPVIDYSTFYEEFDKSIPLYVPANSVEAYKSATYWGAFSNIIGIEDETGVKHSENKNQRSEIIYDLQGRRVEKMEKGIYIINGKKIVVKD